MDEAVEAFVERVSVLTDAERVLVAEARRSVDEGLRERTMLAGAEALSGYGEAYAAARRRVATAHVPDAFEDDRARWSDVARLVQLAIDEGLVVTVARAAIHPNHQRELYRPWAALDAHRRSDARRP